MLIAQLLDQGWEVLVMYIVIIILAFAYHEFAHAIVADRLGDPTPRAAGRITLNPFPHLSLAGLVTLLLLGFGGASTPIRPHLLRGNTRQSHALVAVAGPLANFVMAALFAIPFRLIISSGMDVNPLVMQFMNLGVFLNVFLALFNLLPLPPLDGFSILQGVLPPEMARMLDPLRQYGMILIIGAFFILPRAGIDIFNPLFNAIRLVQSIFLGV